MRIVAPCLLALIVIASAVGRAEDPACTRFGNYPRAAYVTPPPLRTASRPKIAEAEPTKPVAPTEVLNVTTAAKECETGSCAAEKNCEAGACEKSACERKACPASAAPTACEKSGDGDKATACAKSPPCASATACAKACPGEASVASVKACADKVCADKSSCPEATACAQAQACDDVITAVDPAALKEACESKTACAAKAGCAEAGKCAQKGECANGACPLSVATDGACAKSACAKTACANEACPKTAAVACDESAPQCAKLAVASDEACTEFGATCSTAGCADDKCSAETRLAHLNDAADHLTAAGLIDQAESVRVVAAKIRQEVVAKKVAQIATLEAEIAKLSGACGAAKCETACQNAAACDSTMPQPMTVSEWMAMPRTKPAKPKQVSLRVEVIEVSLSKMRKLGFDFATLAAQGERGPLVCSTGEHNGFLPFLEALKRERLVKVLAEPTLVVTHGRPASYTNGGVVHVPVTKRDNRVEYAEREFGTHIDVVTSQVDDKRIRVEIRPRVTHLHEITGANGEAAPRFIVQQIDTGFEVELGATAVLGGQVCERVAEETDPETHEPKMVHSEVQTLFLVTPLPIESHESAVSPASHSEPSEEKAVKRFRDAARRIKASALTWQNDKPLPKIIFSQPTEAK